MTRYGSPKPHSVLRGEGRRASTSRLPRSIRKRPSASFSESRRAPVASVWQTPKVRLLMVWGILLLSLLGLAANLLRLQVVLAPELQERAKEQQTLVLNPTPPRRPIVDRLGNAIAVDRPVYTLYAHPKLFKQESGAIAQTLAPVINRPAGDLEQLFATGESGLEVVYTLPEDVAKRVQRLGLDGLELIERQQRLYPQKTLFGDVVGFVNAERLGQAGIEMSQEEQLQTEAHSMNLRRTGLGSVLPDGTAENFPTTDDSYLRLTLDSRLQRSVRQALQATITAHGAKRGAVLVMDVRDGALVSAVTEPTYDPNQFFEADPALHQNWAVSDLYEPGSTFKPINVAIALESGAVQPNQVFQDDGQIYIGEWTIQNSDYEYSGAPGARTLTEIVQYSSNVGMVRVMQQLSAQDYFSWLEKIGLGEKTGIDLPSETASNLKPKEAFLSDPVEAATTAFGQGFALTPVQMIQLQSSLANGGMLTTPHVVDGLYNADNQRQWQPDLPAPRRLFSAQTTQQVLTMMEAVVDDGTGTAAQIPGYRVAGKTGTAQKASEFGGYSSGARITSFVSFFPADAPRYSILVLIDEPQGDNAYGGTVAAPLAKTVMEAMITILGIPPSRPEEVMGDRFSPAPASGTDPDQYADEALESW